MTFGLEDTSLGYLPQQERLKICKQIRQQQVENYLSFTAQDGEEPPGAGRQKLNKRKTNVHFDKNILLQTAVESFDDREAFHLLQMGADSNYRTGNSTTLLHKCCAEGNLTAAELLIGRGADVNALDDDWWTPLHVACYHDSTDIVLLLLQSGADSTLVDIDGNFPIDHASPKSEAWDVMSAYQETKGYESSKLSEVRLHRYQTALSDVQNYLSQGLDVNKPVQDRITWLHIACANGYRKMIKVLLDNNASLTLADDSGWTPLHIAAKFSQAKVVEMLLKHGADTSLVDILGRKPIDVAGTDEIKKIILEWRRKKRITAALSQAESYVLPKDEETEMEDTDGENFISKAVHPSHLPLSKMEKLLEAQMRFQQDPGGDGEKDEDEMEEDVYVSTIWKGADSEAASLPGVSTTDDLIDFPSITEVVIVKALQERFASDLIYTYIGDILLALNPFRDMPYYAKSISKQYHQAVDLTSLTPHVYAVAEQAYRSLLLTKASQCCMISGESGAGKTESCKFLVQHLLRISGKKDSNLSSKINQVNPLLEAFGNASTVMNANSSRFAKFLEVAYSKQGHVEGAKLSEYLLEKSRVVHQGKGERNFHIFYWMLSGMTPEEVAKCQFESSHIFRYLQSDREKLSSQLNADDKPKFWEVKECLKFVGFTQDDISSLLLTLAAILHLGNVKFVTVGDTEASDVENRGVLRKVSSLLRVPAQDLRSALTEEVIFARGEQLTRPQTVLQAEDSRDALAKSLYSRLFSWIVNGINQMVQPEETGSDGLAIAILDIFGFEKLDRNSFEQICINLANEKLQVFFNDQVFKQEQEDCLKEGVTMVDISYNSNTEVINLFLERNTGFFAQLDDESRIPKATDKSLAVKLHQSLGPKYKNVYKAPKDKGVTFTILHYAGAIGYELTGIIDKNRDTLRNALSFTMRSSNSLQIKELFQTKMTKTGSLKPSSRQRSSRKSPWDIFRKQKPEEKIQRGKKDKSTPAQTASRKGPSTMAYHFKNSLNDMMEKLQVAQPHFIRCIKPNNCSSANMFIAEFVQAQLAYTGVLDTVKIRKFGYAMRIQFSEFVARYNCLNSIANGWSARLNPDQACHNIFIRWKIRDYKAGKTKLFLHLRTVEQLDNLSQKINKQIICVQAVGRRYLAKRQVKVMQIKQIDSAYGIATLCQQAEKLQNKTFEWMFDQQESDNTRHGTLIKERNGSDVRESLALLDAVVHQYENTDELGNPLKIEGREEKRTDEYTTVKPRGDDSEYVDAISPRSYVQIFTPELTEEMNRQHQNRLPPLEVVLDSSRPYPPSPRDMYNSNCVYETIPANGNKVDVRRVPPVVPERNPETRLSSVSSNRSSNVSGTYTDISPPVFENSANNQYCPQGPWQHTPPSSPGMRNKFFQNQSGSPRHQENRPFSYGVSFPQSPKHQVHSGYVNGGDINGQRTRNSSSGSSQSNDYAYTRWIQQDEGNPDLPPYPGEDQTHTDQRTYHQLQCVPPNSQFAHDPHKSSPAMAYGIQKSAFQPMHLARPPPSSPPPPVPPSNACQPPPPPHVTSQIQQLRNNVVGSPKFQRQYPPAQQRPEIGIEPVHRIDHAIHGSPKMRPKLGDVCVPPYTADDDHSSVFDQSVPPPPAFPAPPPPVSPQDRYLAAMQTKRSASPPLPPPPPEILPPPPSEIGIPERTYMSPPPVPGHPVVNSQVPPPPPPISTIPNMKLARQKETPVNGNVRPNVSAQNQNCGSGDLPTSHLLAEMVNIKLKKTQTPQAKVVPNPVADQTQVVNPLVVRLRPTPGAKDIYTPANDGVSGEITCDDLLPPPPPPPPELVPEPEMVKPVAVVTGITQETKAPVVAPKKNQKEKPSLPFNMDIEIPADIDISQVPGVVPITAETPNWRREMIEKKNRDKIEDYVREILKQREEEAKWRDVPEWKRKILKQKKEQEDGGPKELEKTTKGKKPAVGAPPEAASKPNANIVSAAMGIDPAELESMPPWKRELLSKREKVPMTFFNEFEPEEGEEAS